MNMLIDFNALEFIKNLFIWGLPLLIAITLHEAAHGYVAKMNGDNTAYLLGRVSLNPLKHIDIFGTIIIPVLMFLLLPFAIGWAKPVPVNFDNLKSERIAPIMVALAGPATNLLLAIISVGLLTYSVHLNSFLADPVSLMLFASIKINILLMIFNLLPILPLDGGRALYYILPKGMQYNFSKMEKFGLIIILLLAFSGVLFQIITPIMEAIVKMLLMV